MAARALSRALPPVMKLQISPTFSSCLLQPNFFRIETVRNHGFGCQHSAFSYPCVGRTRNFSIRMGRRVYMKNRGRGLAPGKRSKEKQLELSVEIGIENQLPEDTEIQGIAEMMRQNVPMALKLAFERLSTSEYNTRECAIKDVGSFESIELSVLLCNDEFIQKLNKEWRDENRPTDVLSMSQHIPELNLPILMLGDIVISLETAARQAEERGHSLIDEMRILAVHGILHLLGFDHELSDEAEREMENEEEILLKGLGWKGKGLIQSAYDNDVNVTQDIDPSFDRKRETRLHCDRPKFRYIFCDLDGTLLNSNSLISVSNAKALKEAVSEGVNVVIATGKTRPAAIHVLKQAHLTGSDGTFSESSPGVYLHGLLVCGRQGKEIFKRNLDQKVCREALVYSLKHEIPVVAFCTNRCLTLFHHPLAEQLHTIYHEPEVEIIHSVDNLLGTAEIQKLIFLDDSGRVANTLRPYWETATKGRASVVQAVSHMLEIVPPGTSKGKGVKLLLDHLDAKPEEVMAIGDGENDIEMLQLASLGVVLSNGSEKTKAIADVIGISNDEDGVADAIYRYAL